MAADLGVDKFPEICRLCLQYSTERNPLYPLFMHHGNYRRYTSEIKESLPEIISTCIGLQVGNIHSNYYNLSLCLFS